MIIDNLTFKQRTTWIAHCFKALAYQHHRDMTPLFAKILNKDTDTVIDVGAHAGQFTKLFAKLSKKVLSIEPSSYALSILQRVVRYHRLTNVTLVHQGIGETPGTAVLHVPIKKSGSLGFGLAFIGDLGDSSRPTLSEEIQLAPLDEIIEQHNIAPSSVRLIKADVEGAELLLLKGASNLLRVAKPVLYLEVSGETLKRTNASPAQLYQFLAQYGYKPTDQQTLQHQDWSTLDDKSGDFLFT